jgi:hypothetical protein
MLVKNITTLRWREQQQGQKRKVAGGRQTAGGSMGILLFILALVAGYKLL